MVSRPASPRARDRIVSMYSTQLLDYFEHPRNPGEVPNPNASAQLENPACGDVLKLTLRVEGGRIAEARFKAKGCVPSMACASALTEMIQGKTLEQARNLRRDDLIHAVGSLPEASGHAAQLALDVLSVALKSIHA